MNIKIKYFGMINSITGKDEETLNIEDLLLVSGFKSMVINKYPELKEITFQIAVNREIADEKIKLNENDEIALLPPYSGG